MEQEYSFRYASRRGLIGGNPTKRYIKHEDGSFRPIGELCVGAMVRIVGRDGYLIGTPGKLEGTRTIKREYKVLEDWQGPVDIRYVGKRVWDIGEYVYWEHDLELI
jgi:hypothetical protein